MKQKHDFRVQWVSKLLIISSSLTKSNIEHFKINKEPRRACVLLPIISLTSKSACLIQIEKKTDLVEKQFQTSAEN